MKRGSPEDFARSIRLGLKLARLGWKPWILEIDQSFRIRVAGRSCKARRHLSLTHHGCHAGALIWAPKGGKVPKKALIAALHGMEGAGKVEELHGGLMLRRGISSRKGLKDSKHRSGVPVKLPDPRRAALILEALQSLRGWSGLSLCFRRESSYRAAGVRWKLFSDLYFARREGLYWNNFLTSPELDPGTFQRLKQEGFYRRIADDLKDRGFRVGLTHPAGLFFDRNYPPAALVARMASWLTAWRP